MSFFSFHFLAFVSVLFLAHRRARSAGARRMLLTAANLLFLATLSQDWRSWIALGGFLIAGYAMVWLVRERPWRFWPAAFVALSICGLAVARRYDFLGLLFPDGLLEHKLELIGISYMTFKLIHLIVDQHQNQLPPVTFPSYLNYQIGFFALVAGPIQRFRDFHVFWDKIEHAKPEDEAVLRNWNRVVTGMLKLGVVAAGAAYVYGFAREEFFHTTSASAAGLYFVALFYAFPAHIYFNFSGYCDVVIGAAGLLGMTHQENFNRPYLARNLIDFWNRWHISLTLWIRDYVFMAPYKHAAERWPAHAAKLGYLLIFMALFLAGVWHGSTWNFAVFGLIHGLGVMANQIYGDALKARLGRAGVKSYLANPWIRGASMCATFHYVCFSFLFFTPGLDLTWELLAALPAKVF